MSDPAKKNEKAAAVFKALMLYIIAMLFNLLPNHIVGALGLPLFLDSIGTVLAAVLGGYLPGMIVGYMTNIVNIVANPDNAYYAVVNTMIAVAAAFLGNRGFFKKFWKSLAAVPIFAIFGGAFGSIITYLIYGFGIGEGISAPFAKSLLESGKLNVFQAQFISDISIDVVDKLITVIIAFLLLKIIPESIKSGFHIANWRQKPLNEEERKEAVSGNVRKMSLRTKIIIMISAIMFFIAFVTTTISYLLYHNFAIEQYTHTGESVAKLAASVIDGDQVDAYMIDGDDGVQYRSVELSLMAIRKSAPEIEYVYVYKIMEDGCHVVFDLDTDDVKGEDPGTIIPFDESFKPLVPDLLAGERIDPIITDDTYGWLLTIYEPVYNSKGDCVCYAAADIQMKDVTLNGISFITKTASLFLGFFFLILVACIWISEYNLIYPLAAMTISARKFAFDSDEALDVSVERLQKLDIKTGDEIENLYGSLSKTIAQTVGYLEDTKQKTEELAHMQNGLIYVLADLVESRDKNTGDHVRKTAAYVRMMLKAMKQKGMYPDILTDDYVKDVSHSAPLHDVGKIKVSDVILNKPGRLTDEEFEIMKSHTTEGRGIIDEAMKLVSNSGYLKEAKNLATYHHEKWDGTGYPMGLKGEEIPLSARIMAIADVFDALVSKRSYKEGMPVEKALDIIREGAGKHFDPELVELFLENETEVRKIAQEHLVMSDEGKRVPLPGEF